MQNYSMLTDLYQLTMAQGYFNNGMHDMTACFHMYFRKNPFNGGYSICCGIDQLAEIVETFSFEQKDIEYLSSLKAGDGTALFSDAFLVWLNNLHLSLTIHAIKEGSVVFPNEPLVRVIGPILECQLLETALLNCINFQTLIATKAARICRVAQAPVAEFGLRRAQGPAGGVWASRAAFVGGCASTSNVLAGQLFDIPVSGTHAHSWIMSFPDELSAFRAYAQSFPACCVLLVDTYDVVQGIKNAITVGLEMKDRGEKLIGIRIDSGDLVWLSKLARKMLDEAGLVDCGIVLSNDLDEYIIDSIQNEGVEVMSFGVGTKMACAYDHPTLGGVYKLSATKKPADTSWTDQVKVSEMSLKNTTPGILDIRRYYDENGIMVGDMVFDEHTDINEKEMIIDPFNRLHRKTLKGKKSKTLLHPIVVEGKCVLSPEERDAKNAQQYAQKSMKKLDSSHLRLLNPHYYPVGLDENLFNKRDALIKKMRNL